MVREKRERMSNEKTGTPGMTHEEFRAAMKKKGMEIPPEEGPAMIQQKDGTFKSIGSLLPRDPADDEEVPFPL
jgi:hypothetical protein